MNTFKNKDINYISEQDGATEHDFKIKITDMLNKEKIKVSAYLITIQYGNNSNKYSTAICYNSNIENHESLLNNTQNIFYNMFSTNEFLDIIFLDNSYEEKVRKIACPFFISKNFQFNIPDFILTSSDYSNLTGPIYCFKKRKLHGLNPNGYMLCDIKPYLNSHQTGSMHIHDANQIILSARHTNHDIFLPKEFPLYVNVAVPNEMDFKCEEFIDEPSIHSIGWGELNEYISII